MSNKTTIEEIAGKFLGKTADGSTMQKYETPKEHDKTLINPIPRDFNREGSNINTEFVGYEIWHAYEMSFLKKSGMPVTGVLRLFFPSDSVSMIESKSHKLYLNSFDLERFDSVEEVERIIAQDLSEQLETNVKVKLHVADQAELEPEIFNIQFQNVDNLDVDITQYEEDETQLDVIENEELTFHTANLRSNCEITNQKDTGNCYIFIKGQKTPSLEGLTKYIISMRESQHFHENVTEIIYNTLMNKYNPDELYVGCLYNRRGGLDIHCIRADSQGTIDKLMNDYENVDKLFVKTIQC